MLLIPLSPSWQAQPLGELSFSDAGIAIVLSRWPMSRRVLSSKDSIEMLSLEPDFGHPLVEVGRVHQANLPLPHERVDETADVRPAP